MKWKVLQTVRMELSDACIIAVRSLSDLAMAFPIACFGNVRRIRFRHQQSRECTW